MVSPHMLQMHSGLSKFIQLRQTQWQWPLLALHSRICFEDMSGPKDSGKTKIPVFLSLSFPNLRALLLISGLVFISELCGLGGTSSEFEVSFEHNAITSLKPRHDRA